MTTIPQSPPLTPAEKYAALRAVLRPQLAAGLVVAYSGGVDSMFLLWAAEQERRQSGGRLVALTVDSPSLAQVERDDATAFARTLGVEHVWESGQELANPAYVRNDHFRCYHCKSQLFELSRGVARSRQLAFIAYGYTSSDRGDFRPGHKAATEYGVAAPLDEVNLTKEEIRRMMRAVGLPFAHKPASPCLSSRLVTGVAVTPKRLRDVEEIEAMLRQRGIKVMRVRVHEQGPAGWLRIEVPAEEMAAVLAFHSELVRAALSRGYAWATLDLAGYRTGGGVTARGLSVGQADA